MKPHEITYTRPAYPIINPPICHGEGDCGDCQGGNCTPTPKNAQNAHFTPNAEKIAGKLTYDYAYFPVVRNLDKADTRWPD